MSARSRAVRKAPDTIVEQIDDDMLLTSRRSRRVYVLNDTSAVLWSALDEFNSETDLKSLMVEARPDLAGADIDAIVSTFVTQLIDLELVEEVAAHHTDDS